MHEYTHSYIYLYICLSLHLERYIYICRVGPVLYQMQIWLFGKNFQICISFFLSGFASWCISSLISTFSSSAASPMKWLKDHVSTVSMMLKYHKSTIFPDIQGSVRLERMEIFSITSLPVRLTVDQIQIRSTLSPLWIFIKNKVPDYRANHVWNQTCW